MKSKYITIGFVLFGLSVAGCTPEREPEASADTPTLTAEQAVPPATAPIVSIPAPDSTPDAVLETQTGEATYYADVLHRKRTASGEPLDQNAMVAAHRAYPFGTLLRVTNLENDRSVQVRVIDRGPFGAPKKAKQKIIDLSRRAATQLGFIDEGRAVVRVDVLERGPGLNAGQS
jgi:rare lipoprotein A